MAEAERDRLQETINFIARWIWHPKKMTNRTRLTIVKYHPSIKKAAMSDTERGDHENHKDVV